VGGAVMAALRDRGVEAHSVTAPRLRCDERAPGALRVRAADDAGTDALASTFRGATCVVNAAGDPDASSLDEDGLTGANALLPAVVALAAELAEVPRLVHVSSAVVQNDVAILDESEDLRPFSPYSRSKVLGEEVLRELAPGCTVQVVRYRPPSVHAAGRRVTRLVGRVARSAAATVARPGNQPTPQALLPNVADAVAFLATCAETPPAVVAHPSEGVTCESLMRDLSGGRNPRRLPRGLARLTVAGAKAVGRWHRPTAANARRVELLWLGQAQAPSWLDSVGWRPPLGPGAWRALGAATVEDTP
jgi:nucleoside-diphosphate-sugar epimerase